MALTSPTLSYFGKRASTRVISGTGTVIGGQARHFNGYHLSLRWCDADHTRDRDGPTQ
jgi:hypothetical protein